MSYNTNMLPYYPTYATLDSIINSSYKKFNLFLDVKNTLRASYIPEIVNSIIRDSENSKFFNTSVFSSLISFVYFHKIYALKRNLDFHIYMFMDSGESYYHTGIDKNYKKRRKIGNFSFLSEVKREYYYDILNRNFNLSNKVFNGIPNTTVIKLLNLETDFIPYYLIRENLVERENTVQIIYSNDHDFLQCFDLDEKNIFIYKRSKKDKRLLTSQQAILECFGENSKERCENIDKSYIPLIFALHGDKIDDIPGFDDLGLKTIMKNFYLFRDMFIGNSMNDIFDAIINKDDILKKDYKVDNQLKDKIKNLLNIVFLAEKNEQRITKNLKLISFELLSRYIKNNPLNLNMLKRDEEIKNILIERKEYKYETLKLGLQSNNVYFSESELETICE